MVETLRSGPVSVEVRVAVGPDGSRRVLLQLPDGYLLTRPDDARTLAGMLEDAAAEADRA